MNQQYWKLHSVWRKVEGDVGGMKLVQRAKGFIMYRYSFTMCKLGQWHQWQGNPNCLWAVTGLDREPQSNTTACSAPSCSAPSWKSLTPIGKNKNPATTQFLHLMVFADLYLKSIQPRFSCIQMSLLSNESDSSFPWIKTSLILLFGVFLSKYCHLFLVFQLRNQNYSQYCLPHVFLS